eukprot:COSAG05_NODE_9607_length_612_cov_1.093567_1_plen_78_part_00
MYRYVIIRVAKYIRSTTKATWKGHGALANQLGMDVAAEPQMTALILRRVLRHVFKQPQPTLGLEVTARRLELVVPSR